MVFFEQLTKVVDNYCLNSSKIFLCGDFNIDISQNSDVTREFKSILISYGINLLVDCPTRKCGPSETVIDNICSNVDWNFSVTVCTVPLSDHEMILLMVGEELKNTETEMCYRRIYSAQNRTRFSDYLEAEDWREMYQQTEFDDKFHAFFNIINYYFEMSFPRKQCRIVPSNKAWIDDAVIRASQKLDNLYILKKNFPGLHDL